MDEFIINIRKKLIISICTGIIVYIGVTFYMDMSNVKNALYSFSWEYIPLILFLALTNYFIRFIKWEYYLGIIESRTSKRLSLVVFFSGLIMSVTPGKFGEVLKSYLLKNINQTPISRSAPVVFAERVTDFISLIFLSATGVFFFKYGARTLFISIILVAGILIIIGNKEIFFKIISPLERFRHFSNISHKLHDAYESASALLSFKALIWATAIGIVAWLCECSAFYIVLKGFGSTNSYLNSIFIYSFSTIVGAITMMPGGLGTTEGSMIGLLILMKVDNAVSAASTILIRACTLWFAVFIGGMIFFLNYGKVIKSRAGQSELC